MTGVPFAAPERILIVALDNLGDLVFASALAPPLREAFPGAVIDVWCKSYTAPVAALVPHVRRVIAADPFWSPPAGQPRGPMLRFFGAMNEVRQGQYDVALLSEAPWRTAAAVAAAQIPVRIGLARHRNDTFLTHVLPAQDPQKPVVREQGRMLKPFGIDNRAWHYQLDPAPLADAVRAIGDALPPRFAALHPFAGDRARCVSLAEWARVAFELHALGMPCVWIGTADELAELRGSHPHPPGLYSDELGDGSLLHTAAALSRATCMAGHDSGPLHMAAAFGVPVVGVFAPGQPERTFPQGAGVWRMLHRPSPNEITAKMIVREIEELEVLPGR
jgi:ADP-heptose:LPS heptosyltransferase